MSKLSLKHIIGKKNGNSSSVQSLLELLKAEVMIEDEQGKYLSGNINASTAHQAPVQLDHEILGWVKGDDKTAIVAMLLSLLAQKEMEKKKLGSEVLDLYQEVNMVFNFSDKLAQAIGPVAIAEVTIDEAMHLAKSDS